MRMFGLLSSAVLILFASAVPADPQALMERQDVIDLVSGKTVECVKEKDQALCSNYFTEEGVVTRVMHADGKREVGRWFVDDQTRLCILWDRKTKPLCFMVFEQADGRYNLIKNGKHITTITGIADGNTRDL